MNLAQTHWNMNDNGVVRVEGQISTERRQEISQTVKARFKQILCSECCVRPVEAVGRKCLPCAEILTNRQIERVNREHQQMLLRIFAVLCVVGALAILAFWQAAL